MFQKHDPSKDQYMLTRRLSRKGYDWWWHNFTGISEKTGEEKSFFIEYFICNPAKGKHAPVFGQTPKKKKPSYLMVKAGCWGEDAMQLHRFFGIRSVTITKGTPYRIEAGDCLASETRICGSAAISEQERKEHPEWFTDAGSMSWDLQVRKEIAFNVGYATDAPIRSLQQFEMFWHAEGMKSEFEGWVVCNGERYRVKPGTCYGYADKNWGRNFTSPWVWLSSCDLYSRIQDRKLENSAFDIGGGRPKLGMLPLGKKLLGAICYEGEEEEYNFSRFWKRTRTRFSFMETKEKLYWKVLLENPSGVCEVLAVCEKKDMLKIRYEAPDGTMRHKELWNGGTGKARVRLYRKDEEYLVMVDDLVAGHVGCEFGVFAPRTHR